MSRYNYPHTIDNGAGERITFVQWIEEPAGECLVGENVAKPGSGPPMHVHNYQEVVFEVQQGLLGDQRAGEPPQVAAFGETVVFEAGEPHKL